MVNMFVIKKWGALMFVGLFTVICFFIGLRFYGFLVALGTMMGGLLTSIILANVMIKTPFRDMLEGKGLLAVNLDSTGVLRFFIVGLDSPYVKGKLGKHPISDVWDRANVLQIAAPEKAKHAAMPITSGKYKGGIAYVLSEREYNESRFALFHYPVLIWNEQIKSFLTKDFLADKEKGTFAEHAVLFLNRRIEELTAKIRDFGRYVVEQTKPQGSIMQSKWFWIILLIGGGILLLIFSPAIIKGLQGFAGTAGSAVQTATSGGNPIVPR